MMPAMSIFADLVEHARTPPGPHGSAADLFPAGTLSHRGRVVAGWFVHATLDRKPDGGVAANVRVTALCRGRGGFALSGRDLTLLPDLLAGRDLSRGHDAFTADLGEPIGERLDLGSAVHALAGHVGHLGDAAAARSRAAMVEASGLPQERIHAQARAMADVLATLMATFDPEAIAWLRARPGFRRIRLAYEGLDATAVPGAPLRTAIDRHPGLQKTLMDAWWRDGARFTGDMRHDDVMAVVRRSLSPVLPPRLLARLPDALAACGTQDGAPDTLSSRIRPDRGGVPGEDFDPIVDALGPLAHVRAESLPDGPGWRAYLRHSHVVERVSETLCGPRLLPALLGHVPDWAAWARRMAEAAGVPLDDLDQAVAGVPDMAEAFMAEVVSPAIHLSGAEEPLNLARVTSRMLHGGHSLGRILRASRAWHSDRTRIEATLFPTGVDALDRPWRAGLPDHERGDVRIVVLTSQADLDGEGASGPDADGVAGLAHCVGGYARRCRAGRSRILSIRRQGVDGIVDRLSTVEVAVAADGFWMVRQHAGRANAEPCAAAVEALAGYSRAVRAGELGIDRAALAPVPEAVRVGKAGRWGSPGYWETAMAAWQPHMPRAMRDLGRDDLAAVALEGQDEFGWPWCPSSLDRPRPAVRPDDAPAAAPALR